ncbi:MAG: type II toxin-antitoxin system death-on-curing family toxin [bacterium]
MVEAIHFDQIREHGGLVGLLDDGTLEAALARPRHQWSHRRRPDLASLAAAYADGLARGHPFQDGNKRVAFLTLVVFLGLNEMGFDAREAEVVQVMLAVAAGDMTEARLAKWVRGHLA